MLSPQSYRPSKLQALYLIVQKKKLRPESGETRTEGTVDVPWKREGINDGNWTARIAYGQAIV
jgi:hypothetical protein